MKRKPRDKNEPVTVYDLVFTDGPDDFDAETIQMYRIPRGAYEAVKYHATVDALRILESAFKADSFGEYGKFAAEFTAYKRHDYERRVKEGEIP